MRFRKGGKGRLCSSRSPQPRPQIRHSIENGKDHDGETTAFPMNVLEGFKSELNLAGVKIPCAVISGRKGIQRVLTENGITYAILGERSGASKRLKKAASEDGALLPPCLSPRATQTLHPQDGGRAPEANESLSGWRPGRAGLRCERPCRGLQHLAQCQAGRSAPGTTIAEGTEGQAKRGPWPRPALWLL